MSGDVKIDEKRLSVLWADPEHAEIISVLHGAVFDNAWSAKSVRDMIEEPGSAALVASYQRPDNIIGLILGRVTADEGEILTLGVACACRRQGVAKTLVSALKRAMMRAEVSRLFLEVGVDNEAAIKLYRDQEFSDVGHRSGYYRSKDGSGKDALILQCDLGRKE